MKPFETLTRRDFIKMAGLGIGSLTLQPWLKVRAAGQFPEDGNLGRVTLGPMDIKTRPSADSQTVATVYEDAIVVRLREVIGDIYPYYHRNRRWIETPDGYIWSPNVQPVRNLPNPDTGIWAQSNLGGGFWAEVTIPFVDATLVNQKPISQWISYRTEHGLAPRFYYSEVLWIDEIKQSDAGQTLLRVNERYGNPGDIFWAPAEAFRPITLDEITPINPEVEDKKIVVDLTTQSLSCFEGTREVYYCRVSTGLNVFGALKEDYLTPLGNFPVWGKYLSTHMAGGTAIAGWDLPGIGWTSIFFQNGQAVHSTYWHNNFGEEMSNGCVNASPVDAKWIFRWGLPQVDYEPGLRTIQGYSGTTMINVIET
jgi:hypothetical protein